MTCTCCPTTLSLPKESVDGKKTTLSNAIAQWKIPEPNAFVIELLCFPHYLPWNSKRDKWPLDEVYDDIRTDYDFTPLVGFTEAV